MSVIPDTYIIRLDNMCFRAPLGVGVEERIVGSRIIVNLIAKTKVATQAFIDDDLCGSPDYSVVYREISKVVKEPVRLLEHLAYRIAKRTLDAVPNFLSVEVRITKINPPMSGDGVNATVEFMLCR